MWGWLTGQSAPSDEQGVDTGKKGAPTIAGLKTFSLNSDLELQLAAAELLEEVRYGHCLVFFRGISKTSAVFFKTFFFFPFLPI